VPRSGPLLVVSDRFLSPSIECHSIDRPVLIAVVLATLNVDDGFLKLAWLFGFWRPCPLHLAGALDTLPAISLLLSVAAVP